MTKCYAFGCQTTATFLVQSEQEAGFEGIPACQHVSNRYDRHVVHEDEVGGVLSGVNKEAHRGDGSSWQRRHP